MHSVILLLQIQLLILLQNMLFKLFSTIGSQNLVPLNMAHLCSLFHINHSPRTPYSPWTNGLVEVQNRNLGTHLRIFLQNPPTNWSFQTQMYAYAHNTTPLSQLKLSPYQIVFHTHPRIPLTFSLNLPRNASKNCIATYCESLPPPFPLQHPRS